jgi:isopentenyldiphosphate isomerase
MQTNDELLDVVDKNDCVIGQEYRSKIHKEKLPFRVINAFLINEKNELWIPRRTAHKELFPSCLDASVGGHVMAGETYEKAFERELQEELNVKAVQISYKLIGKLTPFQHDVSAFMHVYLINTNKTPDYNPRDFSDAHWIGIPSLKEKIKNGEQVKGDFLILISFIQNLLTIIS